MKENVLIEKSIEFGARIVRLHLLEKPDYLEKSMAASLLKDSLEIKRILITSINTAKQKSCQ